MSLIILLSSRLRTQKKTNMDCHGPVASVWDSRTSDPSSANHNLLPYRQLCVPVLHVTMFESELVQDVSEVFGKL